MLPQLDFSYAINITKRLGITRGKRIYFANGIDWRELLAEPAGLAAQVKIQSKPTHLRRFSIHAPVLAAPTRHAGFIIFIVPFLQ
jgi:hypothetical protein